ncbi:MAG: hypothetical protein KKH98_10995 [Spirochaetes bacterium]|nr:hypothetical protein [Spirochaetota bacterium]
MSNNKRRVPDLLLEQYLLNELPEEESRRIEELLKQEKNGMKRLEKLKESNKEILEKHPASVMNRSIRSKVEEAGSVKEGMPGFLYRTFTRYRYLYTAIGFVVILFLVFIPQRIEHFVRDHETIRIKGGAEFYIYLKEGDQKKRLKNNDTVRAGVLIQVAYKAGDARYGIIFSIDGRGIITLHFPGRQQDPCNLTPGRKMALKEAYELDDAPDYEHFFFIYSVKKINKKRIMEKVKEVTKKPYRIKEEIKKLPGELKVIGLKLVKE